MDIPKFIMKPRDSRSSLWVNGWNIWDLMPKECTDDVKSAIISAYYLGMMHMKAEIMDSVEPHGGTTAEFVTEDSS